MNVVPFADSGPENESPEASAEAAAAVAEESAAAAEDLSPTEADFSPTRTPLSGSAHGECTDSSSGPDDAASVESALGLGNSSPSASNSPAAASEAADDLEGLCETVHPANPEESEEQDSEAEEYEGDESEGENDEAEEFDAEAEEADPEAEDYEAEAEESDAEAEESDAEAEESDAEAEHSEGETEQSDAETEQPEADESEVEGSEADESEEQESDAAALSEHSDPSASGGSTHRDKSGTAASSDAEEHPDMATGPYAMQYPDPPDNLDLSEDPPHAAETSDEEVGAYAMQDPEPADTSDGGSDQPEGAEDAAPQAPASAEQDLAGHSQAALQMSLTPYDSLSNETRDMLWDYAAQFDVPYTDMGDFWTKRTVKCDNKTVFILHARYNTERELQWRMQLSNVLSSAQFGNLSADQRQRILTLVGVSPTFDVREQLQEAELDWQHIPENDPPCVYFLEDVFFYSVAKMVESTKDRLAEFSGQPFDAMPDALTPEEHDLVVEQEIVTSWGNTIINIADTQDERIVCSVYSRILSEARQEPNGSLMNLLALAVSWLEHVGHVTAFIKFRQWFDVHEARFRADRALEEQGMQDACKNVSQSLSHPPWS